MAGSFAILSNMTAVKRADVLFHVVKLHLLGIEDYALDTYQRHEAHHITLCNRRI